MFLRGGQRSNHQTTQARRIVPDTKTEIEGILWQSLPENEENRWVTPVSGYHC
jgi:hypothetical protein